MVGGGGRGRRRRLGQLARLAGSCTLYTALGSDELGDAALAQLEGLGVRVEAARPAEPQRRGFTFVDAAGERTITIIGEKHVAARRDPLPWGELAETDAVYFVSGDADAARAARRAECSWRPRALAPGPPGGRVELDALVRSARDPSERYERGDLEPPPQLVVATGRPRRGHVGDGGRPAGSYPAAPLAGPIVDAYGAGDSFAAGLTYALARGDDLESGARLRRRCAGRGARAARRARPR